ncbi:MAG: hypothetical protein AAFO70_07150, partial [Pseudomonadota bacterium]
TMRRLFIAALAITIATPTLAGDFRLYPGFKDKNAIIEMTTDKGPIVEIVLRCDRRPNGQIRSGIMTYSKLEGLFCDSNLRCFRSPARAFQRTCG